MPSYILKADRDTDLYVTWSTIVDNLTASGTRQEYINEGNDVDRLSRADKFGASGYAPFNVGAFTEKDLLVCNLQTGDRSRHMNLPRNKLLDYAMKIRDNDYDGAEALLTPCQNEEDEW